MNGLILAEDGQKMSKRLKNYPEIEPTLDKHGADALRLYLLASPAMRGDDLNFSEKGLSEVLRRVIMRLENVLAFYEMYKGEDPRVTLKDPEPKGDPLSVLDRWILARLTQLQTEVTEGLDNYTLDLAARPFDLFVDDLSVWYLRRSRERFKGDDVADKADALFVLRQVLQQLAKLLAPFAPFIAEEIWQSVRRTDEDEESVHLASWPDPRTVLGVLKDGPLSLLDEMQKTRDIVSLALEARTKAGIKVRQPLSRLNLAKEKWLIPEAFWSLIKDEVNVKEIIFTENLATGVELDLTITLELKAEGEWRELMRAIQDLRKEQGLKPNDQIMLNLPSSYRPLVEGRLAEMQKQVRATTINFLEQEHPTIA